MNLKSLTPEDKFILNACSLKSEEVALAQELDPKSFNWNYYWEESVNNGVSGILYKQFVKYPKLAEVIPNNIFLQHKKYYYKNLARNVNIFTDLERLIQFLYKKGFENVILIKGAYLLPKVYKDYGIRPLSDIDIVVENLNIAEQISELLISELNFTAKVYRSKWEINYRKLSKGKLPELRGKYLVVELHTPICFNSLYETHADLFTVKTKRFKIEDVNYKTLIDTLHLKLLNEHLHQHKIREAFDLRMILDIYNF